MKVIWSSIAELSFSKELEFISNKWTSKEVFAFMDLVDDFINKLQSGTILGKSTEILHIKSFVISKQTTLFFEINDTSKTIVLLLFWNNKFNPSDLKKVLF